jgi:CubicO group peptidase (beta-lactamase class C family)
VIPAVSAVERAAPAVEVEPAAVGFDAERLARADRYLERYVDDRRLPCTLLVLSRRGKVFHCSAHGQSDSDAGAAPSTPLRVGITPDTVWRIYSMTKPITSVAAMMLYEEGAFELIDPVSRFIPSFADARVFRRLAGGTIETAPATEPIRIWHLLTHTSGLTYSFFFTNPVDAAYRAAGFEPFTLERDPLATVCDRLASLPLLFEPGTEWNYSMSTDVLGRLVEVISGQSLDEFFAHRILAPLGMHDTAFWARPDTESRLVTLYSPNPATRQLVRGPGDALGRERPVFLSGGGGLLSTANDYHRFARMLLNAGELDGVRLLGPRTVQLMTRNHLPGGADLVTFGRPLVDILRPGYGFGLGFQVLVDPVPSQSLSSAGEYGWGGAAGTEFWIDPSRELIAMFFTQITPSINPLRHQLRQMVYQALLDA